MLIGRIFPRSGYLGTLVIGVLLLTSLNAMAQEEGGIRWIHSLSQAQQEAAQTGKLILVHCGAEWCGPCKKMEADVFPRAEVKNIVEANFVPVKLDYDKHRADAETLQINKFPTDLVLSPDGTVIKRLQGYRPATSYVLALSEVSNRFFPAGNPQPNQTQPQPQMVAQAPTQTAPQQYQTQYQPQSQYQPQTPAGPPVTNPQASTPVQASTSEEGLGDRYANWTPPGMPSSSKPAVQPQAQAPATPEGYSGYNPNYRQNSNQSPQGYVPGFGQVATNPEESQTPPSQPEQPLTTTMTPEQVNRQSQAYDRYSQYEPQAESEEASTPEEASPEQSGFNPDSYAGYGSRKINQNPAGMRTYQKDPNGQMVEVTEEPTEEQTAPSADQPEPTSNQPQFGLDGYCPVQLVERRQWTPGDARWGAIHRGQTFLFAGPEEQQRFLARPELYAPVLQGSDPVVALEEGRWVTGNRQFGLIFEGQVFLFSSEDTLNRFSENPDRFTIEALQARMPQNRFPR
ncbi:Hypothetical protein PBC10988_9360 [Planctomycetales bacterium 10988]|nr:Hypothetical protein PBC10988_9360 [Planctomycetales bacterium 10988]